MRMRTRKLIGTIATVAWMIVYSLIAMAVGGAFVVGTNKILELLFYIVAGVLWVPVVMLIIRWMSRPDAGA